MQLWCNLNTHSTVKSALEAVYIFSIGWFVCCKVHIALQHFVMFRGVLMASRWQSYGEMTLLS